MSSSSVQFNQINGTQLYLLDCGGGTSSSSDSPQVYFYLPYSGGPSSITIGDSWNNTLYQQGTFIFTDTPIANAAQFVSTYQKDPNSQAYGIAWIQSPNSTGQLGVLMLTLNIPSKSSLHQTKQQQVFHFENIGFTIGSGNSVTLDDANDRFTIPNNTNIYLQVTGVTTNIYVVGTAIYIPYCGPFSGCLQCEFTLTELNLDQLGVGLMYFMDGGGGTLTGLNYPIFNLPNNGNIMMPVSLDPLDALNDARTFFSFNGQACVAGTPPANAILSYYRTGLGQQVTLAPQPDAKLIFAPNPSTPTPAYYLVPEGSFAIGVSGGNQQQAGEGPVYRVMCGMSGLEYLGAMTSSCNLMHFYPGQNASSASWATATTSWVYISPPEGSTVNYYAQPDKSILYGLGSSGGVTAGAATYAGSTAVQPIYYLEVVADGLPATPSQELSFPMAPYAGVVASSLDTYTVTESQFISPLRREIICGISTGVPPSTSAATDGQPVYGTTPQGLLSQFSGDLTQWLELIMAQMSTGKFMFTSIEPGSHLRCSLQTNQLFLVITDPASIQPNLSAANATIVMGDPPWSFVLDPSNTANWLNPGLPGLKGTILILKFCDGYIINPTAKDGLAYNTSSWAQPATFNTSSGQVSQNIVSILTDAINRSAAGDTDFDNIATIVQDDRWNGILMLNVTTPLEEVPPQLAGLAGGLDPNLFFAHHVGINVSVVSQTSDQNNPYSINSSLFGLINYQAPSPLVYNGSDYQYQVDLLKVLFSNSQVTAFTSQVSVLVNKLFGEPTVNPPAIVLNGVLQYQVLPDNTEVDSYFFETPEGTSYEISMKSKVLKTVEIDKSQFITLSTANPADPTSLTQTRFVFWGLMDFYELEGFDLFSFGSGSEGGDATAGLSFANLALNMSFNPLVQNSNAFVFDASQISFDLATSTARPDSLFNHFPLTLSSFTQAQSGTTPTGLGYMGVQSPLNQSQLNYPWYSLNFDLNLGTIGALAGEAGFVASLTAAWAPNPSNYNVFLGLKLPGSNGSKREISFEGVLGITFKTIEMIVQDPATYILVLYTIALKFLSKSFPSTGQVNFVLFGNPTEGSQNTSLGWYAAYAKPQTNTKGQSGSPPALPPANS